MPCVFAVAAHPDDIEFCMAGTLFLLRDAGWDVHYLNIANGSCGTAHLDPEEIVKIRTAESRAAARHLGAVYHEPLAADLELYYDKGLVARVGSVMREVAPDVLLVPSPQDYMEDHMNACRVAVTAVFCRGLRNFAVDPPRPAVMKDVTVYHAQPYGNRDGLNRIVQPDFFIDIGSVLDLKRAMLAEHKSQKEWLDESQGVESYLEAMVSLAREVGAMSGVFTHAEGWRRHNPLGFCPPDADPLRETLNRFVH